MKIMYDDEGHTSYIYLTSIDAGEAKDTLSGEIAVDLDEEHQIIAVRLFESEDYKFQDRLKYVRENPHTSYDETSKSITISFVEKPEPKNTIPWSAYIDLDEAGQVIGLEMLFASPGWRPHDGRKRVYAAGALKYVSKFRVS